MSQLTTPIHRPRDINTTARPASGLFSPPPTATPPTRTTNSPPRASNSPPLPSLLPRPNGSTATCPSASTPQTPSRLMAFAQAWVRMLSSNHPTFGVGQQVLQILRHYASLEHNVDLWCYPARDPDRPPVDLLPLVQRDLDAVEAVTPRHILADLRPSASPLDDGPTARAALHTCCPVAFDVPLQSAHGMRSAPEARIPHYTVHVIDRTVVAGSGTLIAPKRSTARMAAVLHGVLGQVLVLHFPLTHANEEGPPNGLSLAQQFHWALCQPSAIFRVLYPGESAFVPPMHWRAMITLGCNGSSFAATVLLYVKRSEECHPREDAGERERKRTRV